MWCIFSIAFLLYSVLGQVTVQLRANWERQPFELQLLETIASENESYYLSAVSKITGVAFSDDDEDSFSDDPTSDIYSEEDLYRSVFDLLTPAERSLYDIALANKYHSPRIIAHYKHYSETTLPFFRDALLKRCGRIPKTWLQYNDAVYCEADDIYALRTDFQAKQDVLQVFDRVIGDRGPLLILHGDVKDPQLVRFLQHLFQSSVAGKLRFVWRYTPQGLAEREVLAGYGVDLTIKRTDYIVIDDREVRTSGKLPVASESEEHDKGTFVDSYTEDLETILREELADLDLRIASFALSSQTALGGLQNLLQLNQDLPRLSSSLKGQHVSEQFMEELNTNAKFGITPESMGIFINGAPQHEAKLDIFNVYDEIKKEVSLIQHLVDLGLQAVASKDLVSKFALLSLYKSRKSGTARYDVGSSDLSPVIYLNNIETDPIYQYYSDDIQEFLRRFSFGEIPHIKSNLHETIFVLSLSNTEQLKQVLGVLGAVMENGISQRIGLIPLLTEADDRAVVNNLYEVYNSGDLETLYEFFQNLVLNSVQDSSPYGEDYVATRVEPFLRTFGVERPSLFVNGVFYDLEDNWPYQLARQVTEDNSLITGMVYQRRVKTMADIKGLLYEDAAPLRNVLLLPPDRSSIQYHIVPAQFLQQCKSMSNTIFTFSKGEIDSATTPTLTFGANFGSHYALEQLAHILKFLEQSDLTVRMRLIHTGKDASFIDRIRQALNRSSSHAADVIQSIIGEHQFNDDEYLSPDILTLLQSIGADGVSSFFLLNGRFVNLKETIVDSKSIELFVQTEVKLRISSVESLLKNVPLPDVEHTLDWFETLSSVLTKSYFRDMGPNSHPLTITRYDFTRVGTENALSFGKPSESLVHITVVVDPASELAQKILGLTNAIKDIAFVSIDVILAPQHVLSDLPVKRLYRANIPSKVAFKDGHVHEKYVTFKNVPENTLFTVDLDVPSPWIVIPKSGVTDLDNVLLKRSGPVTALYMLQHLLIEGSALDADTGEAPAGLSVRIPGSDTNVMAMNHGYLQLKANPGSWEFSLRDGPSKEIFSLLDLKSKAASSGSLFANILTMKGTWIYPRVRKNPGKEKSSFLVSDDNDLENKESQSTLGFISSWFKRTPEEKLDSQKKHADINIFSVASGHLYERLLSIMTVSVMRHTSHTVKFWLIDNYMSPTFREFLPHLALKYGFEYELITYKWPSWLRGQTEKQRTIWGYKILFLDVLFPQDLEKVIFVDADQIVRVDMKELVDVDLQGAPYGYAPMGESRKEMEGFRFWKQGYWKKLLGDKLKYHISALYVIDLKRFRSIAAGDRLRSQYQTLSADPESLSNLDQDLPNNMQNQLRIFSLPDDWLWCETWCDDASLKTAKTIDLCNNPLTKEPKLDRARRQIPEWSVYDDEVSALTDEVFKASEEIGTEEVIHDEL